MGLLNTLARCRCTTWLVASIVRDSSVSHVIDSSRSHASLLDARGILHGACFLLDLALTFSTVATATDAILVLPSPNLVLALINVCNLVFLACGATGGPAKVVSTFTFANFLNCVLKPVLGACLSTKVNSMVTVTLNKATLIFFYYSTCILAAHGSVSFLNNVLVTNVIIILVNVITGVFLRLPTLRLTVDTIFVLVSSNTVLFRADGVVRNNRAGCVHTAIDLCISLCGVFIDLLDVLNFTDHSWSRPLALS